VSKYKEGDRVRVRNDLIDGERYYMDCKTRSNVFIDDMNNMLGKETTIEEISPYNEQYRLKNSGYYWTDGMLEDVKEENEI
jgi:hypothetical protein